MAFRFSDLNAYGYYVYDLIFVDSFRILSHFVFRNVKIMITRGADGERSKKM